MSQQPQGPRPRPPTTGARSAMYAPPTALGPTSGGTSERLMQPAARSLPAQQQSPMAPGARPTAPNGSAFGGLTGGQPGGPSPFVPRLGAGAPQRPGPGPQTPQRPRVDPGAQFRQPGTTRPIGGGMGGGMGYTQPGGLVPGQNPIGPIHPAPAAAGSAWQEGNGGAHTAEEADAGGYHHTYEGMWDRTGPTGSPVIPGAFLGDAQHDLANAGIIADRMRTIGGGQGFGGGRAVSSRDAGGGAPPAAPTPPATFLDGAQQAPGAVPDPRGAGVQAMPPAQSPAPARPGAGPDWSSQRSYASTAAPPGAIGASASGLGGTSGYDPAKYAAALQQQGYHITSGGDIVPPGAPAGVSVGNINTPPNPSSAYYAQLSGAYTGSQYGTDPVSGLPTRGMTAQVDATVAPGGDIAQPQAGVDQAYLTQMQNRAPPEMDQKAVDQSVATDARRRAFEASRAMLAASEGGARAGISADAQAGILAGTQNDAGSAAAQSAAGIRMDAARQNFQGKLSWFQQQGQAYLAAAQMAHDDATRAQLWQQAQAMFQQQADLQKQQAAMEQKYALERIAAGGQVTDKDWLSAGGNAAGKILGVGLDRWLNGGGGGGGGGASFGGFQGGGGFNL